MQSTRDSNVRGKNSKISTHLIPAAIAFLILVSATLACGNSTSYVTSTPWPTATKIPPITIEIVAPYRGSKPTSTPIPIPTPSPATSNVLTMLGYINLSRSERGLSILTLDSTLSYLAQLRAEDLSTEYNFGHRTPSYGYLDDMLPGTGVNCCQIGENLARTTSLQRAHEGFMRSPGHSENILKDNFTSVGIGIVEKGSRVIVAEIFCAEPAIPGRDCTW